MRPGFRFVAVIVGIVAMRCGGGDAPGLSHPKLDKDYSAAFVGLWQGSANLTMAGLPPQSTTGTQRIDRSGFNRLTVAQMCNTVDGQAGLDSATAFTIDPLTCPPLTESCGPVTIKYESGSGVLAGETLTLTLAGHASGCGQNLGFTLSFAGTLSAAGTGGAGDRSGLWSSAVAATVLSRASPALGKRAQE